MRSLPLNILPEQLGRASFTAKRPDYYFNQDNPQWPATATLRLSMPTLSMSNQQVREGVAQELARLELVLRRRPDEGPDGLIAHAA